MERRYIESFFFLALLLGTIALVAVLVLPYLNTFILGAILAFLFSGVYQKLLRLIPNRSLAALVLTLLVLITIVAPISLAGYRIAQEAAGLYGYARAHATGEVIAQIVSQLPPSIRQLIPATSLNTQAISAWFQQAFGWIVGSIGPVFSGIARTILHFFFLLLFFYYLTRDGERLKRRLMEISPLSDSHEQEILGKIGRAITATVRGQLVLALLQALVAGIGFALFGVPNPALWGSVIMVAAFIPTLGTALVQVPAIAYLAATAGTGPAIGLALWALVAVGMLDNFLGPRLMARGARIHPLVMMIAVLGGIGMFGPMGILLGPILFSLLYALLDIYLSLVRPAQS
ncbi:MAG: AI-2E family transporter [Candidatus Yanofskybacteria bacterium]|nr:AI-2E family transporter [Candidatus Yanofskybacteria bacterium]